MKYPKSVEAARSIGMDKKALAEALLAEVPLRKGRPAAGTTSVEDALAVIAAEIEAETGEVYAPRTLGNYRKVAEWACDRAHSWADASWTAHVEAYEGGMAFAEFDALDDKSKRAGRRSRGASTGDVPAAARAINENPAEVAKFIEALTPDAAEAIRDAIDDPESMKAIARNIKQREANSTYLPMPGEELARLRTRVSVFLSNHPDQAQAFFDWVAVQAMEYHEKAATS
jgi:glycerol-3-phosphate dehydrogenase